MSVVQLDGGTWQIMVRVSWRDEFELIAAHFDRKKVKTYRRLSAALRHIILDYEFTDQIIVAPNAGQSNTASF